MRIPAHQFGTLSNPLDQLLGAPARVRALRTLDAAAHPLGLAHLAREIAVSYRGAQKAVAVLVHAGIVSEIPTGQGSVFSINEAHPIAPVLRSLFAVERARRSAILDAAEAWADQQSPRPLAIWLFGSAARNEDTFQSDIDLAIVAKTDASAQRLAASLRECLEPIARQHAVHPSVVPYSARTVLSLPEEDAQMWADLLRDATPLTGPAPEYLRQQLARSADARESRSTKSQHDTQKDTDHTRKASVDELS
jgi:predicted nucleotidyltransferase